MVKNNALQKIAQNGKNVAHSLKCLKMVKCGALVKTTQNGKNLAQSLKSFESGKTVAHS